MTDVQEQVSVPADSSGLANALAKLATDLVAAKKSGATGVALVTDAVSLAIADLAGALPDAAGMSGEIAAEPIGVAEAFAIAGFQVARSLTGK